MDMKELELLRGLTTTIAANHLPPSPPSLVEFQGQAYVLLLPTAEEPYMAQWLFGRAGLEWVTLLH